MEGPTPTPLYPDNVECLNVNKNEQRTGDGRREATIEENSPQTLEEIRGNAGDPLHRGSREVRWASIATRRTARQPYAWYPSFVTTRAWPTGTG